MAFESKVRKASLSGNNPSANNKMEGKDVGRMSKPWNVRKIATMGGDNGKGAEQIDNPKRKGA